MMRIRTEAWRSLGAIALLVAGASSCEAIVGLSAYSEGASQDAASFDATRHDAAEKLDAHVDAHASHPDAESNTADSRSDAPAQNVECDAASNCTGATCSVATCDHGTCVYRTPTESSCDGGFCNAAGACVPCLSAMDCPASPNACTEATCSNIGTCEFSPSPATTKCEGGMCDGKGECSSCSGCTPRACYTTSCLDPSGCQFDAAPMGTTCDAGGSPGVCNGAGACVVCNTVADCPIPSRSSCQIATCNAHQCVDVAAMVGTVCSMNPTMYCDGVSEHCVACTQENLGACGGKTPYCSDAGSCVQCTASSQCTGLSLACVNNQCL